MIKLDGNIIEIGSELKESKIYEISENKSLPASLKKDKIYLGNSSDAKGFAAFITFNAAQTSGTDNHILLSFDFKYLKEGDLIKITPFNKRINTLFRVSSNHNTILLTEQCNHYCLMCSQPPKNHDDSWLLNDALELIKLIPKTTKTLGFSGGEPTLYGQKFIDLIQFTKKQLPNTALDILTNGVNFANEELARKFGEIDHPDCYLGIPLYSDDPVLHDYIVQSKGAFDKTIKGILNLKQNNQKVELRVVLHKSSIQTLESLAEYIARNLLFVDQVALMGLEMMGFTRANLDKLWIDQYDYRDKLSNAVHILNSYGINTLIFNHQLCLINKDVEPNYVKSISDWKNGYIDECDRCSRKSECGGFFASSIKYKYSSQIKAFT